MALYALISSFFILTGLNAKGQNILLCPGFEESGASEPFFVEQAIKVDYTENVFLQSVGARFGPKLLFWYKPLLQGADSTNIGSEKYYYSTDYLVYPAQIPTKDHEKIAEGKACVALLLGMEFLTGQFAEPMKKDSVYNITFKIRQSWLSAYSEPSIGILFNADPYQRIDPGFNETENLLTINMRGHKIGRREWKTLEASYKAKGGERFMILGYNKSNHKLDITGGFKYKKGFFKWTGYYLFDDFCIAEKHNTNCANQTEEYINQKWEDMINALKNKESGEIVYKTEAYLNFATNDYALDENSRHILDSLFAVISALPNLDTYIMEIHGHTDDQGSNYDNMILSERRAEAVSAYFISLGLRIESLTVPHGEDSPAMPGTSGIARAANRRVELVIRVRD